MAISSLLPFSWGSRQLHSKLSFIKENNLDPNIYFLGSSVTNRQVMPTLFDQEINDESLSSFNLAIDGTMPPHHFYLLENLLNHDKTIDYVFMELDGFDHMPERHFMTTFSKFYFSPRWFSWSMLNLLASKTIPFKQKAYMSYKYIRTIFENVFFVNMRADALKSLADRTTYSYKVLKRHADGFMYFNTLFTENKLQKREKKKLLNKTKDNFTKAYAKNAESLASNAVYKHMLRKYIKLADKHGVKLYYVITPRHSVLLSAEELLDIKNDLTDDIVLDLANPQDYGDLYNDKLRYDADHLNGEGAAIFTKHLAKVFTQVVQSN